MTLLLKVACRECGQQQDFVELGSQVRCVRCGLDFRAQADGDGASRVLSVSPDELDNVPYSQRSIEIPVNKVSSVIVADPTLLNDKLLREAPLKENCKWVGKVRLLKKLGQGGMGAVYRGYDESLALDVAVKILPLSMDEQRDSQFVERFRQEARISAKINHPNVVRTLHVDEQGDLLYLVMDYIAGQTARQLVDAKGALSIPQALQIIQDATKGMQAAHQHTVVHRDIKPDNILVADDGRVLLTDLGLAKAASSGQAAPVTRMGLLLGTPEYMSPEQWEIGAQIGPASDVWSMGATLFMLLTQKPPFADKDLAALSKSVKEHPIPEMIKFRSDVPASVMYILHRCLAKRPADRFNSATELMAAIDDALADLNEARGSLPVPKAIADERARAAAAATMQSAAEKKSALAPPSIPIALPKAPPRPAPMPIFIPPPRKPNTVQKYVIIGLAGLTLAGGALWTYQALTYVPPVVVVETPTLDLRCSTRVKPGELADLNATLAGVSNPDDFALMWTAGEKSFSGASVQTPLQHDTEFTVVVRDKNKAQEILRKNVTVLVDVQARAADQDFMKIETGTTLEITGSTYGGAVKDGVSVRWVDADNPQASLAEGLTLVRNNLNVGRYTFILQARRKEHDWTNAATDKVVVEVTKRIPQEYKTALQQGLEDSRTAAQAKTGAEAVANWKKALAAFELANKTFPDGEDARVEADHCRKLLAMDEKYVAMLEEGRKLKEAAEALPESDGVRRLAAWSEALRPLTGATALFEREEAREQLKQVEATLVELKARLESAEKERDTFDTMIAKARYASKEAKKYLNPTVALPFWEDALTGFTELSKRFPKRVDEFTLELKEVQDNRDKAYLYTHFGVVPNKPPEKVQEPPKVRVNSQPKDAPRAPATLPDPNRK